jgi:hypothetical protein
VQSNDTVRLLELAKEYTRYLTPMFNLIPWDDQLLVRPERFQEIYSIAADATNNFSQVDVERLTETLASHPETLLVFRTISGYRVQELAYAIEFRVGIKVSEGTIKKLEAGRKPSTPSQQQHLAGIAKAIFEAVQGTLLPRPTGITGFIDRSAKFDTLDGWSGVAHHASEGVPYSTALYERYLGRPFAYAVDALSGRKADLLEKPIQSLLEAHGISHYRSKPIDKIPGFEQAPDFLIPGQDSPRVVIEAKLAEDGGTARDKAARIERLARITDRVGATLIAVVDGKGFFRINDVLAPILRATRGATFTLSTLPEMITLDALVPYRRI